MPRRSAVRVMFHSLARSSLRMKARSKASRASLRVRSRWASSPGGSAPRGRGGREVLGPDDVARAHDHEPLDHVAQLAHVARPVVGSMKQVERPRRDTVLGRWPFSAAELVDEVRDEQRDVLLALRAAAARSIGTTLRR